MVEVFNVGVKVFLNLTVVVLDAIEGSVLSINATIFENLKTPSNFDKLFWIRPSWILIGIKSNQTKLDFE